MVRPAPLASLDRGRASSGVGGQVIANEPEVLADAESERGSQIAGGISSDARDEEGWPSPSGVIPVRRRPTFGSLFAGIGGIDLGLERAGWDCRFQVEWDGFCQRVLAEHWPDVPRYGDIHDVHGPLAHAESDAGRIGNGDGAADECGRCLPIVDLLAGGFPCQPFSVAGRRAGMDDDRWLWPEFARTIRELRPRFVLVENVPGLLADSGGMGAVLGDLADLGYDAEWESIPAAAVGAPHLRYRVWIIGTLANTDRRRREQRNESERELSVTGADGFSDTTPARLEGHERAVVAQSRQGRSDADAAGSDWWSTEPDVGRLAHGVPARVDRLRALGNAVVPQVVEWIGRRMIEHG